jgi:serine/threonine protein phosphatase PrpC
MNDAPPPAAEAACPSCRSARISADGYCESCGHPVPSSRDHTELDLGLLAGVTDRGLRHRRNEDAMALATAEQDGSPVALAVVCDGVSTSQRPDEAALAAANAAMRVLLAAVRAGQDLTGASRDAVSAAQGAVAGLTEPAQPGAPAEPRDGARLADPPSATFVSAVLASGAVTLCWLGDSRAYWLDARGEQAAKRLTTDDSVAGQLIAAGLVSETDALELPHAHVVTGWIGADLRGTDPHVARFEPPGPGALLLCSDGLWNYQPEAAKLAELALPGALSDPLAAAGALVRFALQAGGADNVTVVLAPFPLRPGAGNGPREPASSARPDPARQPDPRAGDRQLE